jgi:hypothetical protein
MEGVAKSRNKSYILFFYMFGYIGAGSDLLINLRLCFGRGRQLCRPAVWGRDGLISLRYLVVNVKKSGKSVGCKK